ncbi:GPP34 family phosphoprotein [Micromonospora sp. NBC_01655]|uniref:GOLPH3/VPS74 family protein n=1 Tax=Micromonospora sp. NBC_01655 TaxID=2975983 RepID=UPI002258857F|nr:GPP34 family phosphoprotein [Micromonospora sp. NBC_01655]MCX4474415.1 GPP34 family phosphoprotein [Micromonospora sp. NBC_01655]
MTGVALAEELLLLAYDDESGKATMPRISLDLGMAAAVLIELALAGRIAYADGNLTVTDPTGTGESTLDGVLARMAADTPHTPSSWVQRLRHGLRDRILGDLVGRGVVRDVDETELGFIHVHRYPTTDASVEQDIRRRLAEALAGGHLPDERTAALATLVAVLRMEPALGLTGDAARDARVRLEEIAGGAGFSGTAGLDDSVVRPSVALVVTALGTAVDAALGKRP